MQEETARCGRKFTKQVSFVFSFLREIRKIFYEVAIVREKMTQIEGSPLASVWKQSFKQNAPFSTRN